MRYEHVVEGRFIERPNRFIARVEIDGQVETVHVKNTGRCRELLQPGVQVYLACSNNPKRSTAYDLVAVQKGHRVVNIDSQAPNKVVEEWLRQKALFSGMPLDPAAVTLVRPETTFGKSRFDFYVEMSRGEKIYMEVKGVTLEQDGVLRFPDAPSERAVKHLEELIQARSLGYRTMVVFVIQMCGARYFTPNRETHAAFAEALVRAFEAGVEVYALDCRVTPESLELQGPVEVRLTEDCAEKAEPAVDENAETDEMSVQMTTRAGDIAFLAEPLLKWYADNRRILPWRENPTPYRVWVSEIMLQQTRVEAVIPYFERFMKALPDISALATASEEVLLKLWEGLGYYNRVRNLQKAAIQIMEMYGGQMPDSYEKLLELKGIGSYTAGAVASIAFGRSHVAVDGNVLRVLSRIRMDERLISDAKVKAAVEQELQQVIPADRPGDFNQAMMEIGACVCVPNGAPHCAECPLAHLCLAHGCGRETDFPCKASAKERSLEYKTILVLRDADRTVLRKRPGKGLLAGMYEFPWMEGHCSPEEVLEYLAQQGLKVIRITPLEDAKHIFTHKEWHMKGYMVRVDELEGRKDFRSVQKKAGDAGLSRNGDVAGNSDQVGIAGTGGNGTSTGKTCEEWLYIDPADTGKRYPIPSAFRAYTKYLNMKLGKENTI